MSSATSLCSNLMSLLSSAISRGVYVFGGKRRGKEGDTTARGTQKRTREKEQMQGEAGRRIFMALVFSSIVGSSSAFSFTFFSSYVVRNKHRVLDHWRCFLHFLWFMLANLPAYLRPHLAYVVCLVLCISRFCLGQEKIKDRAKGGKAENKGPLQCKTYPAHDEVAMKKYIVRPEKPGKRSRRQEGFWSIE